MRLRRSSTLATISGQEFVSFFRISLLQKMVPGVGVEPTRLSSEDFESTASANSATRAWIAKANLGKAIGERCKPQTRVPDGRERTAFPEKLFPFSAPLKKIFPKL